MWSIPFCNSCHRDDIARGDPLVILPILLIISTNLLKFDL